MANQSDVTIQYAVDDALINLEISQEDDGTSIAMASQMVAMVSSALQGVSAHTLLKCPALTMGSDNNWWCSFTVLVERYPFNLPYSIHVNNLAIIGAKSEVDQEVTKTILFNNNNKILIPALSSILDYTWDTPCWDSNGMLIPSQDVIFEDGYLKAPQILFGVLKLHYLKKYTSYDIKVPFSGDFEDPFPCSAQLLSSFVDVPELGECEEFITDPTVVHLKVTPCVSDIFRDCAVTLENGSNSSTRISDPDDKIRHVEFDYCTGDIVAEYYAHPGGE